ncbi:Ribosomal large subunit pseudouridine synthase C [Bienertia sinuspersici]
MGFDLEEFIPIFGEAKPELEASTPSNDDDTPTLNPYLLGCLQLTSLTLLFMSLIFVPTLGRLIRDSIGIGGSMSDFINYIMASLKSKDVKLVMGWKSNCGAISAKLIARKTKGMPLMSISLIKLGPTAASEAMANLSLELYKTYNMLQASFVKVGLNVYPEQERCCQLTQVISAEKEKSQAVKRKLDAMQSEQQGLPKTRETGNIVSPLNSDTSSVTAALNSSDKQPAAEVQSTKVANRVVPAYRRAKVRGVKLSDHEEEEGS